jgi:hypothetical protein
VRIEGFKHYVALAVLTRNIHRIGAILWQQDAQRKREYANPDKRAADSDFGLGIMSFWGEARAQIGQI